jgi:hypothetical protein
MLPDTLVANQVKNAAGTEVEFTRLAQDGRTTEFAKIGESPAYPVRLRVKHEETGVGVKKQMRSLLRFDETSLSQVDGTTSVTDSAYIVLVSPVGHHTTADVQKRLLAHLMSILATDGTGTTVLLDGTGTGAQVLLTGSL